MPQVDLDKFKLSDKVKEYHYSFILVKQLLDMILIDFINNHKHPDTNVCLSNSSMFSSSYEPDIKLQVIKLEKDKVSVSKFAELETTEFPTISMMSYKDLVDYYVSNLVNKQKELEDSL